MDPVIACDLGGTKLIVAVVAADLTILEQRRFEIRGQPYEQIMAILIEMVAEMSRRNPEVRSIGVSAAGNVNPDAGTVSFHEVSSGVVFHPVKSYVLNLRSRPYVTVSLRDRIMMAAGLPAVVENDGNAFALAEARSGVARGVSHVVGITVGTGVASGVIVDGKLIRRRQSGVSLGGMLVMRDDQTWPIGKLASGRGIEALAMERMARDPSAHALRALVERGEFSGRTVASLAVAGDPASLAVMTEVRNWLRLLVGSVFQIFEPELIAFGGGVMDRSPFLLDGMLAFLDRFTVSNLPLPRIEAAHLGATAPVIGAAHIALDLERRLTRRSTRQLIT